MRIEWDLSRTTRTVLYILIAVAGWLVWQRDRTGLPMKLWWTQLTLNFTWTPVFFGAHQIDEVNFLRAHAKNENSDIEFNDHSVREPYESERADYIR